MPCTGGSRARRRPPRTSSAIAALADATTEAAGCLTAISRARFGPDTMTMRSGSTPPTSAMTSLIRLVVPSSTPFISDTTAAEDGSADPHAVRLARRVCDGTASTTMSAPSAASAGSVVARIVLGSAKLGQVVAC